MVALSITPTLAPAPQAPQQAYTSPDTIALQRAYAKQLLAGSDQPIHSWSQGLAGIVDALVGGTIERKAGERQAAGEQGANQAFIEMLTNPAGNGMVPQASAPSSPEPDGGIFAGALDNLPADGAAPAVSPPAAVGAPARTPDPRAIAILNSPWATPAQKQMAMELLKPVLPEYGFETVDGQLIRTDKHSGSAAPIYTAPAKPSTEYGDWQKYRADGGTKSFEEYQYGLRQAGRPVLSPEEAATAEDLKTRKAAFTDHFKERASDINAADDLSLAVDQLEGLLQGVDTGPNAAFTNWVRKNTGIPIGDDAGKIQAVASLVDYLTPRMRVAGSGSTSNFDAETFKNSLPSLLGTPEGNQIVINTLRTMAHHRLAVAQISEDYLSGTIKDPAEALKQIRELPNATEAFKEYMAKSNPGGPPIAPDATAVPAAPAAAAEAPPSGWTAEEWAHTTPEDKAKVLEKRRAVAAPATSPPLPQAAPAAPPGTAVPLPGMIPLPPGIKPIPAPTGNPFADSPMRRR